MLRELISFIVGIVLTKSLDEYQFKTRQKNVLIKEIVDKFLELRKESKNIQVYELRYLQYSGILLLKKEKDAIEVLRQIKLRDKPVVIPEYIRNAGILLGLTKAIDENVDIDNFRDLTIKNIEEAMKK